MKIKKGDKVKVIKGKDRGKTGIVSRSFPKENKVLIEGINTYKKHRKPRKEGEKGEILVLSKAIAASNVMLLCPKCGKPTRVGFIIEKNKSNKEIKQRVCKKCQAKI